MRVKGLLGSKFHCFEKVSITKQKTSYGASRPLFPKSQHLAIFTTTSLKCSNLICLSSSSLLKYFFVHKLHGNSTLSCAVLMCLLKWLILENPRGQRWQGTLTLLWKYLIWLNSSPFLEYFFMHKLHGNSTLPCTLLMCFLKWSIREKTWGHRLHEM